MRQIRGRERHGRRVDKVAVIQGHQDHDRAAHRIDRPDSATDTTLAHGCGARTLACRAPSVTIGDMTRRPDRRHGLQFFAANGRRPFPARPSYANAPRRQGKLRHDQQNHALDGSGTFAKNSILTRGKGRSERPIQRPLRLKVAAMSPVISVSDLPVTSPTHRDACLA